MSQHRRTGIWDRIVDPSWNTFCWSLTYTAIVLQLLPVRITFNFAEHGQQSTSVPAIRLVSKAFADQKITHLTNAACEQKIAGNVRYISDAKHCGTHQSNKALLRPLCRQQVDKFKILAK
jgi:hypothetical protein